MEVPSQAHAIEDLLAHSSWLSALALQLIRDVAEAEEFVQETWLKALAKPPRKSVPIRPWLTRVLRNTVYEKQRGSGRRRDREVSTARSEALPSTTEMIENVESQTLLAKLVLELEEPYKSTVMLRYYEGLKAAEIARRMDIPAGTVRWRLSEGLKQLKDALDRRHGGDRMAWCSALAPLAGVERIASASTAGVLSLTLGILTMKPVLFIGVVLLGAVLYKSGLGPFGSIVGSDLSAPLERTETVSDVLDPEQEQTSANLSERASLEAAPAAKNQVPDLVKSLLPLPNVRLLGRAVDDHGRVVSGALLSRITLDWKAEERTDSKGRFDFEVKRPQYLGNATMWITSPGRARTKVRFNLKADTVDLDLGDIVLSPGGTLRGRVQNALGDGLEGAEVLAVAPSEFGSNSPYDKKRDYNALSHTLTDENGEFELTGVPVGFVDVWAQQETLLSDGVRDVRLVADEETPGLELTLREIPEDAVITGIVLDMDEAPVPNAPLQITRTSENGVWSNSTHADNDGRFRLERELEGPITIEAHGRRVRGREGFEHHRAVAERVEPGTRNLVLQLREPRWIEIAARDERGRSVRVESIKVARQRRSGGGRTTNSATLRAEEGADSVSIACPLGSFGLVIDATGYKTVEVDSLESEHVGEGIEILLERLPVLTGIVSVDGEPIENALVQLYRVVADNEEYVNERFPVLWLDVDRHGTMSGPDGTFVLPIRDDEIDSRKTYVLQASTEDHAPSFSRTIILDGLTRPDDFEFEMSSGGSIGGHVMLLGGATPAGTVVGASNGDGTLHVQTVGSDGAFRFDHLMPGNWFVQRMETEYGFGEGSGGGTTHILVREPIPWSCRVIEGEVTTFDLDLRRPTTARLTGQLKVDGVAPGAWKVSLNSLVHRSRLISQQIPRSTTLDLEGNFELEGAPPGEYVLAIRNGNWDKTFVAQKVVLIQGDQSVHIEFSFAPFSGRIDRDLDGERLFHIHETASGATVTTPIYPDADGAFEARVPVGAGRVLVGKTFQVDKATTLLETDTPPQGTEAIELD